MRATVRRLILAASLPVVLAAPSTAAASTADEAALAARYAPVVRLVAQTHECGPGEPYVPMDVNLLFDEPTVALRGPWGPGDLVKIAPTAKDLAQGLYEYHLDFPGNALDPGCSYERWARRLGAERRPTVYAHVATDRAYPGRLALQYWLFYPFNDWNNLHEGDWEMIQLDFAASDAPAALSHPPTEVGYSQHEGAERARWGDPKLQLVDGTHPVVYPAAGSHANFYDAALYLGSSGSQGVGCDDTQGPSRELRPAVDTIPSDPAAARAAYPWVAYQGRWGEEQPAFFNGPTGPNLKTQWTEPIRWAQDWRDRSYAVPAGGLLGTRATDFFCSAVGRGSETLRRFLADPLPVVLGLAALVALAALGLARATWRPAAPLRVARRRSWGQILAASAQMYGAHLRLFLGIGVLFIPVSLLVTALQAGALGASSVLGVQAEGEGGGAIVLVAVAIGTALTLLGIGLVQAATARALLEIDAGARIGAIRAYRLALDAVAPLLGAIVLAVVAVSLLAGSLLLLPLAVWLAVRLALVAPVVELERRGAVGALRRSSRLVRGDWLKVGSLTLVGAGLALASGPLVAGALIFVTSAPLSLLNLLAGLVYAVTMPYVALTTAYVYLDVRAGDELAPEQAVTLPAEVELPV